MKKFLKKWLKTSDDLEISVLQDKIEWLEHELMQARANILLLEGDLGVATEKNTCLTRQVEELNSRFGASRSQLDEVNSKLQLISSIVSSDPGK